MPQQIDVPGMGVVEFPDGMTDDQIAAAIKANSPAPTPAAPERSVFDQVKQQVGNVAAGAVRGAGSIGATILSPYDMLRDAMDGGGPVSRNKQRRADMDAALQTMGAEPDSLAYQGGKIGGEIAGTAGTGGLLARGLSAVPGVASAAPGLLNSIRTAGMSAGGGSAAANLATRTAGGAINGAASAALVNPDDAGTGALIGGALPGALKVAGAAGKAVGGVMRGPAQSADMAAAVKAARDAGYVIPPTQANPTLVNRLLEGISGKISTAQNASAANQSVTNAKAASSLGLAADTKLTPDLLAGVRKSAGSAYDAVSNAGTITPSPAYSAALDKIAAPALKAAQGFPNAKVSPVVDLVDSLRSPSFDAGSAVAKIKELRSAADDAFRAGNTDVARASKAAAAALESAVEDHLTAIGNPDALQAFRDARQLIAKTYSVEKALNPASGSVDARKLATQLAKGKPLSGGLRDAADFASRFPKAAQATEGMGSLPQTSPLDWAAGAGMSAATSNPLGLLGVAVRPAARALTLSGAVQNRLVQKPGSLAALLSSPEGQQALYRAAPLLMGDR